MANFDYISASEFRQSLEADYAEMQRAAEAGAWKSVLVVAGSIVETLLIDNLAANPSPTRSKKDPLKLDLSEAIETCLYEQVISQRTADLCSVIRSYRNLIHPGRLIRLNEPPPTHGTATIALALVDMIAEDVAKAIRATVGLTGEQILSKILRDSNSLTILGHLLAEVSETQRAHLLLELLPKAHQAAQSPEAFETEDDVNRLEKA